MAGIITSVNVNRRIRHATWIFIAVVFIICIGRCVQNLDTPTLWFDESGQFYMAKGMHHWSAPGTPDGSIADVIYNNARYNLDPGGFTLLLRWWSMVDNGHIWLRALPLLFWLMAIALTAGLVRRLTGDYLWGALTGLLLFTIPRGIYPFLLRPYSMELAGIIAGALLVFYVRERPDWRRILTASVILSVFSTARYAGIMAIFVDCCFILYFILKSADSRRWMKAAMFAALPAMTVALCYLLSMRIQYQGGELPSYIPLLSRDLTPLRSLRAIALYAFIIIMGLLWKRQSSESKIMFLLMVSTQVMFIGLSLAGLQPWILWAPKGGFLMALLMISMMIAVYPAAKRHRWTPPVAAIIITTFIAASSLRPSPLSRPEDDYPHYRTYDELQRIDLSAYPAIYTSFCSTPEIRYLFEYGAMSDRREELRRFFMVESLRPDRASAEADIISHPDGYEYILEAKNVGNLPSGSLVIISGHVNDLIAGYLEKLEGYDFMYIKK